MNAITFLDTTEADSVSCPSPLPAALPVEHADRLKPARGIVLGLLVSLGFWVAIGVGAWLIFGR